MDFPERFETYLQSHVHPDVQPLARRAVQVGQVSIEGFLEIASIFQANHEALDADAVTGVDERIPPYENVLSFDQRKVDL